MIIEQIALALVVPALGYLISVINGMQKNIQKLLLDVAILKDRNRSSRASDRSNENSYD
jgi:hypothetical protein